MSRNCGDHNVLKHKIGRFVYNYLLFFSLVAFMVSCTMVLFVTVLANNLDIEFTEENLGTAAKLTFVNVIVLSALFTIIDTIRRKLTTEKITKQIAEAARKVVQGDFSVRIPSVTRFGADEKYNDIIASFNTMTEELSGVETLRADFISNVSHEMKTPLAVIKNYGTLLQNPDISSEMRMEYARGVAEGSRRLADMITNVLKLNSLEKQKIFPNTAEYDLGEQLCECLLIFENTWDEKHIEIETDIEGGVKVNADEQLLSLVWNNLLSNAFKFTPENGSVSISLKTVDDYAIVRVKDSGCGMSTETGTHIFEKFYQGDTSHATEGNGLGLALVKRIVDIVHGEINVESSIGEGSVFTVTISKI